MSQGMVGRIELTYAWCLVKFLEYGKCPLNDSSNNNNNNNIIIFIIIIILVTQRSQGPELTRVDMVSILSKANEKH